jgi:hypothetical protein
MTKGSNKGIKIIRSLQSAQVGPLVQITVADNTPDGADVIDKEQYTFIFIDISTANLANIPRLTHKTVTMHCANGIDVQN